MSMNVHGHKQPEPWGVNQDNPVFQRHIPETPAPEVQQGLHGAPALQSELEPPAESPALPAPVEVVPAEEPTEIAEDVRELETEEEEEDEEDASPVVPETAETPAATS
jgi:hypothetical protein